jgi:hypothetical protein
MMTYLDYCLTQPQLTFKLSTVPIISLHRQLSKYVAYLTFKLESPPSLQEPVTKIEFYRYYKDIPNKYVIDYQFPHLKNIYLDTLVIQRVLFLLILIIFRPFQGTLWLLWRSPQVLCISISSHLRFSQGKVSG